MGAVEEWSVVCRLFILWRAKTAEKRGQPGSSGRDHDDPLLLRTSAYINMV